MLVRRPDKETTWKTWSLLEDNIKTDLIVIGYDTDKILLGSDNAHFSVVVDMVMSFRVL
jgi:hypothetical protein